MDEHEAMRRADEEVLDALCRFGSDMSSPHEIECLVLFSAEDRALECGRALEAEGFDVDVGAIPLPWWRRLFSRPLWACRVRRSLVPQSDAIHELSRRMQEAATRFSGSYDGWGCAPVLNR